MMTKKGAMTKGSSGGFAARMAAYRAKKGGKAAKKVGGKSAPLAHDGQGDPCYKK